MKVKGIKVTFVFLILALVLMPFPIYAAEQTQIVPTWNWGSQYANQFTVTNFCEGSGTAVSCELRFTANNSYYGYLSFDGYNGTTKWIDYKNVWIADGYGAYRYSIYQNGVIQINKINIEGGFLKSSMDNLDLQDIIDLLTAIETDTTSIDNQLNTELQRLQSIINNQITQNGYLETLTKLRQWNFPIESLTYINWIINNNNSSLVSITGIFNDELSYYSYPVFTMLSGSTLCSPYVDKSVDRYYECIFGIYGTYSTNEIFNMITYDSSKISVTIVNPSVRGYPQGLRFYRIKVEAITNQAGNYNVNFSQNKRIIPIFAIDSYFSYDNISTDFALLWGLSNRLLNNIDLIAQGTQQSNSAASGLESNTNQMQSDFNSYYSIENSANSDFNSALNGINFNDQIAGNQSFLDSASFVKTVFSSMMQIPILSTFVIILCIVLMARIFL